MHIVCANIRTNVVLQHDTPGMFLSTGERSFRACSRIVDCKSVAATAVAPQLFIRIASMFGCFMRTVVNDTGSSLVRYFSVRCHVLVVNFIGSLPSKIH